MNAKYGGATHDAFIWENSLANSYMQELHRNNEKVWLLGKSRLSFLIYDVKKIILKVFKSNIKHEKQEYDCTEIYGKLFFTISYLITYKSIIYLQVIPVIPRGPG